MTIEMFYVYTDDTISNEEIEGKNFWYKEHFKGNKHHRLDGPAVEYKNGHKEYFIEDKRHRLDGPAVEHPSGYKEYWVEDKYHRLDGPAIEHPSGFKRYFVNGVEVTDKLKGIKEEEIPKYLRILSL